MPSVAGQIRIDVLANTARFSAGMREASQSLGNFSQEYDRTVGKRASRRDTAALLDRNKEAASYFMRSPESGPFWQERFAAGMRAAPFGISPMTAGELHASRLRMMARDLVQGPWGMTTRTTLTREAAETAAAIGAGSRKVLGSLRLHMSEMGHLLAEIGAPAGLGMLGRFFTTPTGIATAAGALIGAKAVSDTMERTRWVQQVHRLSQTTGQSLAASARLLYGGMELPIIMRFQKALARPSPEQRAAFQDVGMLGRDLAGKSLDKAMLDVQDAFSRVADPAKRSAIAMELFGRQAYEVLPALAEFRERLLHMPPSRQPTPREAEAARQAELAKQRVDMAWGLNPEAEMRMSFFREKFIRTYGLSLIPTFGILPKTSAEKEIDKAQEDAERRLRRADYDANRAAIERHLQNYQAGIDREKRRGLHEYDAADIEERSKLGIKSPYGAFREKMQKLDLAEPGLFSEEERQRRERELRQEAVGQVMSQYSSVQPAPAMAAGSAEAYSAIVASQLADPKISLAAEANAKLSQIIQTLRAIAAKPAVAGTVLGARAG